MDSSDWYVKQRSQVEEALWTLKQRFRRLQDYRRDMQGLWDDDASSEVNKRYFNPHGDDGEQTVASISKQMLALRNAESEFQIAKQHGLEVDRLLGEVEKLLEFVEEDLSRAYSEYGYFQDKNSEAKAELPTVDALISKANSCCDN